MHAPQLALLLLAGAAVEGSMIPLMPQVNYKKGEPLSPLVNSLTSTDGIIPFNHYDLKMCKPPNMQNAGDLAVEENVGMMIRGDRVQQSPYIFKMLQPEKCKVLKCKGGTKVTRKDLQKFKQRIENGYRANMILDNLPLLTTKGKNTVNCRRNRNQNRQVTDIKGYALGSCQGQKTLIHNHLDFIVKYNTKPGAKPGEPEQYFVVGFKVTPRSIDDVDSCKTGETTTGLPKGTDSKELKWSYSVTWVPDKTTVWVTRWDDYLNSSDADSNPWSHWVKLVQSLLILLCLTFMVGIIFTRTLRLDLSRYNADIDEQSGFIEEFGWKLVEADVFRPPKYAQAFAAVVGTAAQLMGMALSIIVLALLGFLNPSWRGGYLTSMIFIFVLMAFMNGYVTGHMQMMFKQRLWKTVCLSSVCFPGFVFLIWSFTEVALNNKGSANAVPLHTVVVLIGLWFGVSVPLVLLGASCAYKQCPLENPRKYNEIGRQIPPQHWVFSTPSALLLPGVVPYAMAHYEVTLILRSMWQGQVYYVFGFLAMVFIVVAVSIAQTVIVFVYYQLVGEDHRWWWSSILIPLGTGFYFFLYSIIYFNTILSVKTPLAIWVYFSVSFITSLTFALVASMIGFASAFLFVRKIYSSIKFD